jgi:hypothetical protein
VTLDDQRMAALQRANEIRRYRSRLKAGLKSGEVDPVELFEQPFPDQLRTMKLGDLLLSLPRFGQRRVQRILNGNARPGITLGALTDRQKQEFASSLRTMLR